MSAKTTISLKGQIELHTHMHSLSKTNPGLLREVGRNCYKERERIELHEEESSCSTGLLYVICWCDLIEKCY